MTDKPKEDLAAALVQLQAGMPHIAKKTDGQFGKYADLAVVVKELRPVMANLGLAFTAKPTIAVRDNGDREFVLAYKLVHAPSGETEAGEYPLPQGTPQALGSAITYARRYALCAVTGAVADTDDDGRAASQDHTRPARARPPQRAAANLPRNRDGSVSRSKVTDEELDATGQMTAAQIREHNQLERDAQGTGPQGTQRLDGTPDDDTWQQPPPLRTPQAAQNARGAIHQHFKRLKFDDTERDQRLGAMSAIIGRTIASTNDLTAGEGADLIRFLGQCRDRDVLIERLAAKAGEDVA